MNTERRHFNRVAFKTPAKFYADKRQLDCEIIDISLHGALILLLEPADIELDSRYQVDIPLTSQTDGEKISMELELTHQHEQKLGLVCTHIDLDSITHLRRLVELNLGDSQLLERDFSALCSDNE
ncbi:PilZ domain-containing protein [Aliikangiella maris]|uniref:Cyclic diguanosine monophosphate-binding protein n=2 Tax=Aliikangiella maris TaxID=3162458 RepID=A0ABV3MSR3_9GAMM